MRKLFSLVLLALTIAVGDAQSVSQPTGTARRIVRAASLPATCTVGDVYFKTAATVGTYQCLTTNAWTAIAGSSGASPAGPTVGCVQLFVDATHLGCNPRFYLDTVNQEIEVGLPATAPAFQFAINLSDNAAFGYMAIKDADGNYMAALQSPGPSYPITHAIERNSAQIISINDFQVYTQKNGPSNNYFLWERIDGATGSFELRDGLGSATDADVYGASYLKTDAANHSIGLIRLSAQTSDILDLLDSDGTTKLSFFDKDGILRAAGYKSSDGSAGKTCSVVAAGATITVKDGLITALTGC